MPLPLREFYPITRAAELLDCTVDDLIHWAVIGEIELCIKLQDTQCLYEVRDWRFYFNEVAHLLSFKVPEYNQNISVDDILRMYLHKLHGFVDFDSYTELNCLNDICFLIKGSVSGIFHDIVTTERKTEKQELIRIERTIKGLANTERVYESVSATGLFILDASCYGKLDIKNTLQKDDILLSIYTDDSLIVDSPIEILKNDLYLFKDDFLNIRLASEIGREVNVKVDENAIPKKIKRENKKVFEMHARRREEVLKAALYMKANHPELCTNNTKWAESINDHAHKFWPDGECRLSVEVITKLLSDALHPERKK